MNLLISMNFWCIRYWERTEYIGDGPLGETPVHVHLDCARMAVSKTTIRPARAPAYGDKPSSEGRDVKKETKDKQKVSTCNEQVNSGGDEGASEGREETKMPKRHVLTVFLVSR